LQHPAPDRRHADWDGDGRDGRFARIHDPERTPIERWQPPA
jgi:hypothetical protein